MKIQLPHIALNNHLPIYLAIMVCLILVLLQPFSIGNPGHDPLFYLLLMGYGFFNNIHAYLALRALPAIRCGLEWGNLEKSIASYSMRLKADTGPYPRLNVEMVTIFKDNWGRSNYHLNMLMEKKPSTD